MQPEQAHREQGEQSSAVDDVAESLHVRVEVSNSRLGRLSRIFPDLQKRVCDCVSAITTVATAADQEYEAVSDEANCYCHQECPQPGGQRQAAPQETDKLCYTSTFTWSSA